MIARPGEFAQSLRAGAAGVFARPRARYQVYLLIAAGLFLAATAARGFHSWRSAEPLNFIVSDGRGMFAYLPSLVLDGDVNLRNQMIESFGEELARVDYDIDRTTVTGVVHNKYPIGLAVTLAPAFVVAHGVALIGGALTGGAASMARDGYSLPYQLACLAMVLALATWTMVLLDRLMQSHLRIEGTAIAAGVILFWLGSHYAWYCFREPFMVHTISTFWVTLAVYAATSMRFAATTSAAADGAPASRTIRTRLPLLAFATGMAIICRPTNAFVFTFIVWAMIRVAREGGLSPLLRSLPLALICGALPLLAQAGVWRAMHGSWVYYSYDGERFVWSEPALFHTLFSLRKGLFVWTPLLIVAMFGLLLALRRGSDPARREVVGCWMMSGLILWYCNSAWWAWGFGWSFGARAFIELAGMFVIGLAIACEWVRRQRSAAVRRFAIALIVAMVGYNYVLMALYQTHRINRGDWQRGAWNLAGAPQMFLDEIERDRRAKLRDDSSR